MALLQFLLRSLKVPATDAFDPRDPDQFQSAVVWLENTKVRHYPEPDRHPLKSNDPAVWRAALDKYLTEVECPIKGEASNQPAVLQWLLTHAVGVEYTDASEQYNEAAQRAESAAEAPEQWVEPALPPLPDASSEAVQASLLHLQQLLHVEDGTSSNGGGSGGGAAGPSTAAPAEDSIQGLQRAHAMLESCVLPALAEQAKQQGLQGQGQQPAQQHQEQAEQQQGQQDQGHEGQQMQLSGPAGACQRSAAAAMLAQYPLGFSTSDRSADLGATILRMLYIKDLRALQTLVDSAIVQVQEYTANPRTDASLGKVGR